MIEILCYAGAVICAVIAACGLAIMCCELACDIREIRRTARLRRRLNAVARANRNYEMWVKPQEVEAAVWNLIA